MELIIIAVIVYFIGVRKGRKTFYDDMLKKEFEEWKKSQVQNKQQS